MTANWTSKILIKHVTGRLLLDTALSGCSFTLVPAREEAEHWQLTFAGVDAGLLEEIASLQEELNLFYFEQDPDGTLRKWWLYDTDCPLLAMDAAAGRLELTVNSRRAYSNERAQ